MLLAPTDWAILRDRGLVRFNMNNSAARWSTWSPYLTNAKDAPDRSAILKLAKSIARNIENRAVNSSLRRQRPFHSCSARRAAVDPPCQNKQIIRQPVEVNLGFTQRGIALQKRRQRNAPPAGHRAGHVQGRPGRRSAGRMKCRGGKNVGQPVDLPFQPHDVLRRDRGTPAARVRPPRGRQVRAQNEQFALNIQQNALSGPSVPSAVARPRTPFSSSTSP